jgi:ABC-type glycerol-3-phosphate transport system permease component
MTGITVRPGAGRAGTGRAYCARAPRRAKTIRKVALNGTGLLVAVVVLFPIFWVVSTAFKPATEIYSLTPHPVPAHPTLGNFNQVINGSAGARLSFWTFWNEFVFVLTFPSTQGKYTLPIYVQYSFSRNGAGWDPIMAASTLYTIPPVLFFLIVQRRMVGGLVAGSVKG